MSSMRRLATLALATVIVGGACTINDVTPSFSDGGVDAALADTSVADTSADGGAGDASDASVADSADVLVVDATPLPLAIAQPFPGSVAVDGTRVYWGNRDPSGGVMKVPLNGGGAQLISVSNNIVGVAIDATSVYFTRAIDGVIAKTSLDGGLELPLATPGIGPQAIAVDGVNVYWTLSISGVGGVYKAPISGGSTTPLDTTGGKLCRTGIAVDGQNVYWAEDGCGACNAMSPQPGRVMKVPIGGGNATPLATMQQHPTSIAVDSTNVYWTNSCDGTVMKVPIGGGNATPIASAQSEPYGLTVDATSAYFTNHTGGTIAKVSLSGGLVTTLASAQSSPLSIAVDSSSVYWANSTASGAVMKCPK